jgi:hypothetical protein
MEVMPSGRTTVTAGQLFVAGDENDTGLDADDARLIAAAPDLLEACGAVDTFYVFFESHIPPGKGDGAREALRMVRAAIAKAKGYAL